MMNDRNLPFYIALVALIIGVTVSTTGTAYTIAAFSDAQRALAELVERLPAKEEITSAELLRALSEVRVTLGRLEKANRELAAELAAMRKANADRLGRMEDKIDAIPVKGRR